MKTIEEMADAYCRENAQQEGHDIEDVRNAYLSGAEHVYEELTRWNDPDESRPNNMQRVLVKCQKADGSIEVDIATFHHFLNIGRGSFCIEASRPKYIIGWREIH